MLSFLHLLSLQKLDQNKSTNRVIKNLSTDRSEHYIKKSTFGIALGYASSNELGLTPEYLLDESYFVFDARNIHYDSTKDSSDTKYTSIPYGFWGNDNFPDQDKLEFARVNIENYTCLQNDDYFLQSDSSSTISSSIVLTIYRCNETNTEVECKSTEEIDSAIRGGFLHIQTLSGYFDSNDYKTPIKTYLNDRDILTLNPESYQSYELKVQQNEALLSDNVIFSSSYESHKFYSLKDPTYRIYSNISNQNNVVAFIFIEMSKESIQYERVVYTFFDMFGFLGGLFDAWYFIGYIFVAYFNDKHYKQTILSKLYQVEQANMTNEDSYKKNSNKVIKPKSNFTHGRHLSSQSIASK